MARCLIIGCGCRGRMLARELVKQGHVVRGTTREPRRIAEIEAVGVQGTAADPDRLATLVGELEHVSVACVLLGSATGDDAALRALHGERLDALLHRMLDTTVRGVLYEAAGTVSPEVLAAGAERVREACSRSRIPYALLQADPADPQEWLADATSGVARLLNT